MLKCIFGTCLDMRRIVLCWPMLKMSCIISKRRIRFLLLMLWHKITTTGLALLTNKAKQRILFTPRSTKLFAASLRATFPILLSRRRWTDTNNPRQSLKLHQSTSTEWQVFSLMNCWNCCWYDIEKLRRSK